MSGTIKDVPADCRNSDLINRLLAATPPYQTNSTFVPSGFYFSEMLKRFVQAKSCTSLPLNKKGRKRNWKDNSKLEPSLVEHKKNKVEFANTPQTLSESQIPLWYPSFYQPSYPPLYFKSLETEPLNLQIRSDSIKQDRHYSAFRVPESSNIEDHEKTNNKQGTNYLMENLTKIYKQVAPEEENIIDVEGDESTGLETSKTEKSDKKDCEDLTALIGLELVVDYVKHGTNKNESQKQKTKAFKNHNLS
ncbi:uncharacterized protein LOC126902625 isoform X2 [Daktulosphaira vitifoliae]|nr:uncharacterized protein LOC126902625 isoform X2 [Daktulosphaira vitifoliae]XP_050536043.1 uncharacterized protein LOC126902625 isoform X2 [Daktulosphaira vitifoliae]